MPALESFVPIAELTYLDAPANPAASSSEAVPVPVVPATMLPAGWKREALNGMRQVAEAGALMRLLRTPARFKRGAEQLQLLRDAYYGKWVPRKLARVDGRYYREFMTPGRPSRAYDAYVASTVNRLVPFRADKNTLNMVFLAITKKCPLACAHCFEWDALNQKEKLTLDDLKTMVAKFQARQVSQIFFSGGEPMLRVHDLLEVLQTAQTTTDFWVITSGFNFTLENALKLKQAGLTGVSISLDHHEPHQHNAFRGFDKAYENALQAAVYAREVGLVVNLGLCATREFTTKENLLAYAELAKRLGVTFIQILEPRAIGHYAAQDVALSESQLQLLDDFYEQTNYTSSYQDFPIVHYYGYHQRRIGCNGAADRFLYVDTDGDLHACPFCQKKQGSALGSSLDAVLDRGLVGSCQQFKQSTW